MMKLLTFELWKIWSKRNFQVLICVLLIFNVFMLWYLNIPKESEPPLSAYKALSDDLAGLSEVQKLDYITDLKKQTDGICTGNHIMDWPGGDDERKREDFLRYTGSLAEESVFLNEIYHEIQAVSKYEEYLDFVQENRETLSGISIFAPADKTSFASRNAVKSAEDHLALSGENVRYFPSKGFALADGNRITELFMLLSIFLFAGSLISEEKEKGLFYITRSTKRGIAASMGAKILALFVHSMVTSVLFYGSNLLYAGAAVGFGDLGRAIQSVPDFRESSLPINFFGYLFLGILLKTFVLFGFGAVITGISVLAQKSFIPLLCGVGIVGGNLLLFAVIPASSIFAPLKFLSLFGLLKPELLLGGYLNFDIAGRPISRLSLSIWTIAAWCIVSVSLCFLFFGRKRGFDLQKTQMISILPFKPHTSLFLHETYKIMVMGKAGLILLLFIALIAGRDLGRTYYPSIGEQYYRDIMGKLEGERTEEKEAVIAAEQERFDEAFAQIETITDMVAAGDMDESAGDDRKAQWLGVLSFYPSFQRVLKEYEHIKESGGVFVYETGYLYLFGKMDHSSLVDFLLISLGIVFAFGNVMAMEDEKKSWNLLLATAQGKRAIIRQKVRMCAACVVILTIMPWGFRIFAIGRVYPLRLWTRSIRNLPMYFETAVSVPIWLFAVFMMIRQIAAGLLACAVVLFLSWQRKNYLQTTFIACIVLVVPLTLALMGFDFAKWVSFYPLYGLAE